ncbi:MAG: photosynthetic protein synthase [Phycisphaerales bacterium]|nr:photosynthetic protein synthase [Phycisphaerales bacterium]
MSKPQKIFTTCLWGVLLLAMAGVVAGKLFWARNPDGSRGLAGGGPEVLFPAAEFRLTDQDAKPFGNAELKGRPYVAAFVFTTCGSICPRMTTQMAALQKDLPAEVQLVSFSVDPKHDTPEVLKRYAATYKADESRWHFLTGEREAVVKVVGEMKLPFKDEQAGDHPILHSERLLLIDGDNRIRGTYLSHEPDALKKLVADAKYLAGHPGDKAGETGARS